MGKMVKIAHVIHSFGNGGMEKGVATLVRNTSDHIEHFIICLTRAGEMERLLPPGTKIIECHKQEGNSIKFLEQLSKILRRVNPDVVHTRNWAGTDGIIASRIAKIRSVVHSEHGFGSENPDGMNSKRIWAYKLFSRWVQEYICVSMPLKEWLEKQVRPRKAVSQIYNGVDTDTYFPGSGAQTRKQLGISQTYFVVGIVASLYPIKDHITLIQAFNLLRQQVSKSKLIIVGSGPERRSLETLATGGVLFLGNRNDVPEVMRAFDVYVLSSINEGISNTILEAMATGSPVVASNVGGNPDLIVDGVNGRLFPSGDFQSLSSILYGYYLSSDLRNKHGTHGRSTAVSRFSIKKMVENYETVWERVMRG